MSSSDRFADELGDATEHLLLSPHYDDIPLSAGATVRRLADRGLRPRTLVIFGSEPDREQPLSPFAEEMHAKWGLSAGEVVAHRQAEERTASRILGAETAVLPFHDAIYRGHTYLSDDDLFGDVAAAERALPAAIVAALPLGARPDPSVRLYAPLAVGRHVDHQLAFRAGVDLARRGWDVWFYEDTPYTLKPGAFASRLADIRGGLGIAPVARIPVAATWDAKLDAILSYPSQLETIFRDYVGVGASRDEIGAALWAYAEQAGDGAAVERFWKINDASSSVGS
jgi:LmbE family N-acetylglucosaminyl deacetylase